MNRILLTTATCALAGAMIASADVPSLINYQGRLTDSGGAPVTGSKNFDISIYDAATGGNLLYSETIGAVTLDSNGVYSFQFGNAGTSNTQVSETIGTTADSTLSYTKTLSNTPVVANSITITDGTNSWSQSVGNPGVGATATANTIVGFVIGATITNGGSGYTSAPAVTITGSGSGATATATLTNGVVTGITIISAGSGYTGGATISIAPPVIPFRVDYSGGAITATYSSAPSAGQAITASYRYVTNGISGALSSGAEHWMAVSVDGTVQGTRQRVLAVPFAHRTAVAEVANGLASREVSWKPDFFFPGPTMTYTQTILTLPLYSGRIDTTDRSNRCFTVIPSTFKYLKKFDVSYYLGYMTYPGYPPATSRLQIELVKKSSASEEILNTFDATSTDTINGYFVKSFIINQLMDSKSSYSIRLIASDCTPASWVLSTNVIIKDISVQAIE